MKPRSPEAQQLEQDYLRHVSEALAGHSAEEVAAIVESVREHIELAAADLPDAEITAPQMQDILERLGPPQAYLIDEEQSALPEVVPLSQAAPAGGCGAPLPPLEFGSCLTEAVEFYRRNFVPLLLASILFNVLSTVTCLILAGPLTGGAYLMVLKALRRDDQHVEVGDLFGAFNRFGVLLVLFFLQTILILVGFVFLIVPGLLLATIWLYAELMVVDRNAGILDALKASYAYTTCSRFGTHFLIATVIWAAMLGASSIHYVGIVLVILIEPICWLLVTIAYRRQTQFDLSIPAPVTPPPASPQAQPI